MKIITAGECIKLRVEAVDEQSGISKVEVEATNLRDLPGSPTFEAKTCVEWPAGQDAIIVSIQIPDYIPDSKWKISSITLVNGTGRSILYSPSKDFTPILFSVKAKAGMDLTPAELKSVTLIDD
jgi:hypothetical protein